RWHSLACPAPASLLARPPVSVCACVPLRVCVCATHRPHSRSPHEHPSRVCIAALLCVCAHPAIVEAVIKAAPLGTHFGNDHPLQVEWAERIQSLVPCAGRVRFTNSGTESDMLACRVARAYTGQPTILRFEGHF